MPQRFFFLLIPVLLAGCSRKETVERYPGGEPKRVHVYSWPGAQDSLHLRKTLNYSLDGQLVYEADYHGGKLHGEYRSFFNRFTPSAKGHFRNGLKEGLWTEYWEDNHLRRRGEYREGREKGEWVSWSALGAEIERNSCYPANDSGRFQSFFENGSPREQYDCRRGKRNGAYSEMDALGNLLRRGFYDTSGSEDSLWESFHEGGKPASRRLYRAGQWEDTVWAWDISGKVVEQGVFRAGTGTLTRLDGNGKRITVFRKGVPHSLRRWHANGKLAGEGVFTDGKKTGLWRDWDERGTLREFANYEGGMLHGERRFFDSTGTLTRVQKYFRGIPSEGWFPKIPGAMKKKAARKE